LLRNFRNSNRLEGFLLQNSKDPESLREFVSWNLKCPSFARVRHHSQLVAPFMFEIGERN